MGPAVFIIAIMGCGESDASCQEVRLADARYESIQACSAATEAAVMRHTDIDYPVVVAQCRPQGEPATLNASDVLLPPPEETALFPNS